MYSFLGFKVSALDIEKELLGYPLIDDVSVMGINDPVWGQRIFSLLVLKKDAQFDQNDYVKWCKSKLPKQSVPTLIKIIDKMPRNQLGKVNKKELIKTYEELFKNLAKWWFKYKNIIVFDHFFIEELKKKKIYN